MIRRVSCLAVVALVGFGMAGCGGGKLGKGEGRLIATGDAFVGRAGKSGKSLRPAGHNHVLRAGDRVEVRNGDAHVDIAKGGKLELSPPVSFTFSTRPFLSSGTLLVEPEGRAISVTTDDATVTVDSGAT